MPGRIVTPPLITETTRNGLVLVDAVNDASVIFKAVPFRMSNAVKGLMLDYARLGKPGFYHRYACSVLVGSFKDAPSAEAACVEAERYLRTHPAPGVKFAQPITRARQPAYVFAFTIIPLGHINTHWDDSSRSVINETQPDHQMHDGFVVRQIAQVEQNLFVSTYGEGDNTDPGRAYLNGTIGTDGFRDLDQRIYRDMRQQTGFLNSPLSRPLGTQSAYESDG